ncbi:LOW QUALITY PROTEIN: TIP41-like protein [Tympanuchus pallidicinctus]|uniref:LOW QUALITY PROTEIN: TIP41-like protein n=1 Tax=Tympanuchus pallidicinctus TaxID=109042 RepID=UPI0022871931|nr:LOW QUALITY PROTEIN: TIP41-like protein [Tympanuchus pallidicinctus]
MCRSSNVLRNHAELGAAALSHLVTFKDLPPAGAARSGAEAVGCAVTAQPSPAEPSTTPLPHDFRPARAAPLSRKRKFGEAAIAEGRRCRGGRAAVAKGPGRAGKSEPPPLPLPAFSSVKVAPSAFAMHPVFQSSRRDFTFGPWKLSAVCTHIMKSAQAERLAEELQMPSLPEMMFGDNILRIQHERGFGIEFNATDALKCVNNCQGMIKVACAEEWQESRSETEHTKEVVKPYDWTYTTDYKGTLLGDTATLKVVPTTEHINTEKLKAREQIMFFEEVLLFEDELHDHGVSSLSVKIRVMPSSFFVLLRFFLRVDGVLIRMNDTRLHHESDKAYMLREYTSRESKISSLKHVPPSLFTEPNEISQYLPIKETICEKLEFPGTLESNNPEASLETTCVKSK